VSDCCPLCSTALEHRVGRGLELRRFPRGRMICPHDQKRWHLKLEAVRREIDLCRDAARALHLRSEFEDMLLQHMGDTTQLEPVNLELLETA
jgi:hypothetical protein